jgi:hypothetical protein
MNRKKFSKINKPSAIESLSALDECKHKLYSLICVFDIKLSSDVAIREFYKCDLSHICDAEFSFISARSGNMCAVDTRILIFFEKLEEIYEKFLWDMRVIKVLVVNIYSSVVISSWRTS